MKRLIIGLIAIAVSIFGTVDAAAQRPITEDQLQNRIWTFNVAQNFPGGIRLFIAADCSLTSLNCVAGDVCLDNLGGVGNARHFQCDPAADGGSGDFIAPTNLGSGGAGNTLDDAYDEPTAHAGRTINIDFGFPVLITDTVQGTGLILSSTVSGPRSLYLEFQPFGSQGSAIFADDFGLKIASEFGASSRFLFDTNAAAGLRAFTVLDGKLRADRATSGILPLLQIVNLANPGAAGDGVEINMTTSDTGGFELTTGTIQGVQTNAAIDGQEMDLVVRLMRAGVLEEMFRIDGSAGGNLILAANATVDTVDVSAHVHDGGAGDAANVPEANVTMDDATGHKHSGAGGNGTIVTDLGCTDCVGTGDIDLAIVPSWTGQHDFALPVVARGLVNNGGFVIESPYNGDAVIAKANAQEECASETAGVCDTPVPFQTKMDALFALGFNIINLQSTSTEATSANPAVDPGGHDCDGDPCYYWPGVEDSTGFVHIEAFDTTTSAAFVVEEFGANVMAGQAAIDHGRSAAEEALVILGHPQWTRSSQQFDVQSCVQKDEDAGPGFVHDTTDCNSAAVDDVNFMPAVPVSGIDGTGDTFYIGGKRPFPATHINLGVSGTGTYTLVWEYFNGSSYTALTNVVDDTGNLKNAPAAYKVSWEIPSDWATDTIDTDGPFFFMRFRIDTGAVTILPLGTTVQAADIAIEALTGYKGLHGLEVWNETVEGSVSESLEIAFKYLDRAVMDGFTNRFILVSSSDCQGTDGACPSSDRNANHIYVPTLSPFPASDAIKDAYVSGNFIAAHIDAGTTAGDYLLPEAPPRLVGNTITFQTQSLGAGSANADCTFFGFGGEVLATDTTVSDTLDAEYTIEGGEGYVVARCDRDGVSLPAEDVFWTQPIWVRGAFPGGGFQKGGLTSWDANNQWLPRTARFMEGSYWLSNESLTGGGSIPMLVMDTTEDQGVFDGMFELHQGGTGDPANGTTATARQAAAKFIVDNDGTLFLQNDDIGHGGNIGNTFYDGAVALVVPGASSKWVQFGLGSAEDYLVWAVDELRVFDNDTLVGSLGICGGVGGVCANQWTPIADELAARVRSRRTNSGGGAMIFELEARSGSTYDAADTLWQIENPVSTNVVTFLGDGGLNIVGAGDVTVATGDVAVTAGNITLGGAAATVDGQNLDNMADVTNTVATLADLTAGSCTAGQIRIDTGVTIEWCVCGSTNVWGCWKLTDGTFNAAGPAD